MFVCRRSIAAVTIGQFRLTEHIQLDDMKPVLFDISQSRKRMFASLVEIFTSCSNDGDVRGLEKPSREL